MDKYLPTKFPVAKIDLVLGFLLFFVLDPAQGLRPACYARLAVAFTEHE
jgi:hypothetical protein